MFNWKPNADLAQRIEERDKHDAARYNDLKANWERDRADLWKSIQDLTAAVNKPQIPPDVSALEKRMVVLETWHAQLHTLLTERGNTGKDKLSRTGNALSKFYNK